MKKLLLFTSLMVSLVGISIAQGLEGVIVEKYYISDANDATVNSVGGVLPVGSVTYRVYLDLAPDYIFQSAYGDPLHEFPPPIKGFPPGEGGYLSPFSPARERSPARGQGGGPEAVGEIYVTALLAQ